MTTSTLKKILGTIDFILCIGAWFWAALVLTILWAWFLVKPWNVPHLTYAHALGLMVLVWFFNRRVDYYTIDTVNEMSDENTIKRFFGRQFVVWFGPLFSLILGWFVHWYV